MSETQVQPCYSFWILDGFIFQCKRGEGGLFISWGRLIFKSVGMVLMGRDRGGVPPTMGIYTCHPYIFIYLNILFDLIASPNQTPLVIMKSFNLDYVHS